MKIDFSKYETDAHSYLGSDDKRCIFMDNKYYMIKLPNKLASPNSLHTSVSNNVISEYIGSHIMQTLGLSAQNTLLGFWGDDIVVACEDFREDGYELHEFSWYMQNVIPKSQIGRIPTYEQLYRVFNECALLSSIRQRGIERYWDIIVGDALIGNYDRHKDNFGFLVNRNGEIDIAPVYDCGSCLYPALAESQMEDILSSSEEIERRLYEFPKIALNRNANKNREDKFGYFELLSSNFDKECTKALFRVCPKINIDTINRIVDETLFISDMRKRFYKEMIAYRYKLILQKSYEMLLETPEIKHNLSDYVSNLTFEQITHSSRTAWFS